MATDTLTKPVIDGGTTKTRVFKNFIDGEWVESVSGQTFEDRNPADTREVVAIFQRSNKEDVDAAVNAAKRAFAKWRLVPAPRRAEMVFRAAEILMERKEEYARDMTREMGKVLKETRGDVQEAIDAAYYNAGEGRRMFGPTVPSELPNKFAMAVRQPIGVCGMITPWNFPDGNFIVETAAGRRLRQRLRHQARTRHAAVDFQPRASAYRRRHTQGRDQHRDWIRNGSGNASDGASVGTRHFVDGILSCRQDRGRNGGQEFQALLARTGRQKSDDRAR